MKVEFIAILGLAPEGGYGAYLSRSTEAKKVLDLVDNSWVMFLETRTEHTG